MPPEDRRGCCAQWPLTRVHVPEAGQPPVGCRPPRRRSSRLDFGARRRAAARGRCAVRLAVVVGVGSPRQKACWPFFCAQAMSTPLPTRHCQAQARRNGLVIAFRGRKMHQGQTSGSSCISVPRGTLIISQKNAHAHSKEARSKNFSYFNNTHTHHKFAPSWCVWS